MPTCLKIALGAALVASGRMLAVEPPTLEADATQHAVQTTGTLATSR
jgi:hypothetical protein